MGFKCPICLNDFKYNKDAWNEHIKKEHYGAGKAVNDTLLDITKDKCNCRDFAKTTQLKLGYKTCIDCGKDLK